MSGINISDNILFAFVSDRKPEIIFSALSNKRKLVVPKDAVIFIKSKQKIKKNNLVMWSNNIFFTKLMYFMTEKDKAYAVLEKNTFC